MPALPHTLAPRIAAAILLAVALSLAAGCGRGKGDVSGKVTYNGKPLPFGNVQFISPAGNVPGEIKPDGTYSVTGVPVGLSKIAVNCQDPAYADYMKALSASIKDKNVPKPKGNPEDFDKIPRKYFDPEQSGLTYEVKSGAQTYDIDLK